jgi:hypothetical protein
MSQGPAHQKTKAELNDLSAWVRETFLAKGINVLSSRTYNDISPYVLSFQLRGKVKIAAKSYDWSLYFEVEKNRVAHVSYQGPGIDTRLSTKAELNFNPKKFGTATHEMQTRIEKHDASIEKMIADLQETLHIISIFNKTISAALTAFTSKIGERSNVPVPKNHERKDSSPVPQQE